MYRPAAPPRPARWLAALLPFTLGPVVAAAAPPHQHAPDAPPLRTDLAGKYRSAAQEFGVSEELLLAVSYSAGQWFPAQGGAPVHTPHEAGHMALRTWGDGPSATLAAELLGLPVETVLTEPAQNLRGGAALLAFFAEQAAGAPVAADLNDATARAWWEAVAAYAGVESDLHADIFAKHVFHAVETGLEGVDPTTRQWIASQPLPLPTAILEWSHDAEAAQVVARCEAQKAQATDYPDAAWAPACSSNYSNYSRTAADIYYVIIHVAEGSYNGTISWFQNCSAGVSAHYTVSKYGDVTQSVLEQDVAWHAGNWDYNLKSVGIEHEGYTYTSSSFTDAMYQGSAALTANIAERNGIPKNRTYIIGHNEVPGCSSSEGGGSGCHTDPGPYWNWSYYMGLVGGGGGGGTNPTPTPSPSGKSLVGIVAEGDIYSGPRIPGASVRINTGSSTTTDSSGYYSFSSLTGSSYTVTVSATGYNTASRTCTMSTAENWCSVALTKSGGSEPEPPSGGCEGAKPVAPPSLISAASTTPRTEVPPLAWMLLGGLLIRPIMRRSR